MKKFGFDLLAASNNAGKLHEMQKILSPYFERVLRPADIGLVYEVEETGKTFEENSLIKCRAVSALAPECAVISDDSGLCVEALGGRPGVYSARYGGADATDGDRIQKLLGEMDGKENRRASFVCAVTLILPDGRMLAATGKTDGYILERPDGAQGFGYDPIFFSDGLNMSFGKAAEAEKNAVSHRARALKQCVDLLTKIL